MKENKNKNTEKESLAEQVKAKLESKMHDVRLFKSEKERKRAEKEAFSLQRILSYELFQKIKKEDISYFTRQLATLLMVGVPVLKALDILSHRIQNRKLRKIIFKLGQKVEEGSSLSDAMREHKRIFNQYIIQAVKAGEESGRLGETLNLISDYLDSENRMNRKFKNAMKYPFITMLVAFVVIGILVVRVFPVFSKLFEESNKELPLPTKIVLGIGGFIANNWFFLLALIVVGIFLYYFLRQSPNWANIFDYIKLKIPIIGQKINIQVGVYRFSSLLATMLKSGVNVHDAIEIVTEAVGNSHLASKLEKVHSSVMQGETIENSLRKYKVFPPIVTDIVGVGEQTGSLDIVLERLSATTLEQLNATFDNISVILEPFLILVVGSIVALIALSLFIPYFSLGGVILHY